MAMIQTYDGQFDFPALFGFFQLLFLLEFFQPSVPSDGHQGVHVHQLPKLPHHWQLALLLHIYSSHTSTPWWPLLVSVKDERRPVCSAAARSSPCSLIRLSLMSLVSRTTCWRALLFNSRCSLFLTCCWSMRFWSFLRSDLFSSTAWLRSDGTKPFVSNAI